MSSDTELKFLDKTFSFNNVTDVGNIFDSLVRMSEGFTEVRRIGRKVIVKSIEMRYFLKLHTFLKEAEPEPGDIVRIIIYLDKQCNGNVPALVVNDILEVNDELSMYNLSNQGRFTIIYDKTHGINYTNMASETSDTVTSGACTKPFHFFTKCNIPIYFTGTDGAIDKVASNNIGVLGISDRQSCLFKATTRVRFVDT